MQAKDKYLEKISILILTLILSLCLTHNLHAKNIFEKVFNYNNSLKNSSANFVQINTNYIQEGIIFFGNERIKINYNKPQNITIILSEKKGVYINHKLKETEFFFTKKSYLKNFFDIFHKKNHIENMELKHSSNQIEISEKTIIDNTTFNIKLIYENDPIKLRRLEIVDRNETTQIGFFNHSIEKTFDKSFFTMVDPYLN